MNDLSFQKSPDKSQISYFLLCNYIGLFIPVARLESDRLLKHAQSLQLAGDKSHTILPGLFTLLFIMLIVECLFIAHILIYILHYFINIGCATLYYLSMMYVTVYSMSFNCNCRILAVELNYRFTTHNYRKFTKIIPLVLPIKLNSI